MINNNNSPPSLSNISSIIQTLQRNVDTFSSRIKLLGSSRDSTTFRNKLHTLIETIESQIKQVNIDLALLNKSISPNPEHKSTIQRISNDFSNIILNFKSIQAQYQLKNQADINSAKSALNHLGSPCDLDNQQTPLLARDGQMSLVVQQQQDMDIAYNETLIAEREIEIMEIEQSVHMVNDIFRKIGSLVRDQATTFDHIESNLESAHLNTENANLELSRAVKRQRSWREIKCWILVLMVSLFAILTFIFLLT